MSTYRYLVACSLTDYHYLRSLGWSLDISKVLGNYQCSAPLILLYCRHLLLFLYNGRLSLNQCTSIVNNFCWQLLCSQCLERYTEKTNLSRIPELNFNISLVSKKNWVVSGIIVSLFYVRRLRPLGITFFIEYYSICSLRYVVFLTWRLFWNIIALLCPVSGAGQ